MNPTIFIPTKGRPNSSTAKLLDGSRLDVVLVVEPAEEADYREVWRGRHLVAVLPGDNRGLASTRNFILNRARVMDRRWFWMLDDDITGFTRRVAGKNRREEPAAFFALVNELVSGLPDDVAQAALEYQQFSWAAEKEYAWNSYCDVAVAINVPNTKMLTYDGNVVLKEDRDFTLQALSLGFRTVRFSQMGFAAPTNASNKGGLQPLYLAGREEAVVDRMVAKWGDAIVSKQVKKGGRVDCKINWRYFRPKG